MINRINFGMTPAPASKSEDSVEHWPLPTPISKPSNYEIAEKKAEIQTESQMKGGRFIYVSPAGDTVDINKAIKDQLKDKYVRMFYEPEPIPPTVTMYKTPRF